MMVLKLILPTICLVLLVRPAISDIGNKWTDVVSDIEKTLFNPDFKFRVGNPGEGMVHRNDLVFPSVSV